MGAARHLMRDHLTRWGLADLVDETVLVVSELVTNAVRTGCRRRLELGAELLPGVAVRITVRDGSCAMPVLMDTDDDFGAEGGRGLPLVNRLTDKRWGVILESSGKKVWAIIGGSVLQQLLRDEEEPAAVPALEAPPRREQPASLPAANWLASAAGRRAGQVHRRWREGDLAPLPIGVLWDVARMPAEIALPLLADLRAQDSQRLGPVLHDQDRHTVMWLVTPGMNDHWPPTVDLLRTGALLCPPPPTTDIPPGTRTWAHWPTPTTPIPLTAPPRLATALHAQAPAAGRLAS